MLVPNNFGHMSLKNCHGNAAKEIEIWISSLVTVHTQSHASNVPVAVSADLHLSPITTVCFSPHFGPGSGAHRHFATQPIIKKLPICIRAPHPDADRTSPILCYFAFSGGRGLLSLCFSPWSEPASSPKSEDIKVLMMLSFLFMSLQ